MQKSQQGLEYVDQRPARAALQRCRLTVQVSTTLNRSHVITGEEAIILPCLARSERDEQGGGEQFVTVEDSMSVVHRSRGRLRLRPLKLGMVQKAHGAEQPSLILR